MRSNNAVSMLVRLNMEYTLVRSQHNFRANHATERSCRRTSSSINFPMCIIALKKAGPFVAYFQSEVPPSTLFTNKQEQSTPYGHELSPSYSRELKNWRFSD